MTLLLKRQIPALTLSTILSVYGTAFVLNELSQLRDTVNPETHLTRIALALSAFFLPILGGWIGLRFVGGAIFALFGAVIVFFVSGVTDTPVYIWFLMEYASLCYLLFRTDQGYEDRISVVAVDREKYINEKNDLEIAHKAKGEGISILFEKYSTYYNLRKLAEELATSLSVSQLAQSIVQHSMEFIPHADFVALSLSDRAAEALTLVAHRQSPRSTSAKGSVREKGDLFDFWVMKNQRRLIVSDVHQDFRFDIKEASKLSGVRSLIIAPLIQERRVIGILRMNASEPESFNNDDLRLLDTIAVLASSALSNAMLYEQTEELAIRDSLTNLYVRRYFFDRLKEEHRRALMTHRPLSVLMCDLDHFKESNDRYGHAIGDLMLIEFSNILKQYSDIGIVGRYGGEEFSILLPEMDKKNAAAIAEQIRSQVEKTPFVIRRQRIALTVSIGVASLPDDALDCELLIEKADQALYQAKRRGRNQVCSSAG